MCSDGYKRGAIVFLRKKRGQTVLDYTILIALVLASLLVFRRYIQKGINGRFKAAGDAIGHGRIYIP